VQPVGEAGDDAEVPPPPRSTQNGSALSRSLARTMRPSAVTTSAASRLSRVRPQVRLSQPKPPPTVRPAIPVSETSPPVTARLCSCVASSSWAHTMPASAVATRRCGSTSMLFIGCRSTSMPSSHTDRPGMLWPPPRTAIGSRWCRAKRTWPPPRQRRRYSGRSPRGAGRSRRSDPPDLVVARRVGIALGGPRRSEKWAAGSPL
jgi:hypothetical protein